MASQSLIDRKSVIRQAEAIVAAVREAVRDAIEDHRRTGDPIVLCDNGNIRWVAAEDIVVPEAQADN